MLTVTEDTKKETTSRWDKIPEVIQQMILKLLSVNDSTFARAPVRHTYKY